MKTWNRSALLGLVGTAFGLYMMTAPAQVLAQSQQFPPNAGKPANASTQIVRKPAVNTVAQDPVEVVKASAARLGFDAKTDTFSLLSKTATQAVVSVRHGGAVYNVTLKLSKGNAQWTVVAVSKVKNSGPESPNYNNSGSSSASSSGTTTNGTTTTSGTASSSDVTAAEQKAVELLNADRRANGLSDLTVSAALTAVAQSHAQDMVDRNFFSHTNPDGKTLADRLKQAGISYSAAGENIAENTSVQTAETSLMNSSGHRANILNSSYTAVGVGVAFDNSGNVYVAQDFIKY